MSKSLLIWAFCGILLAGIPAWVTERDSIRDTHAALALESLHYSVRHQDALFEHALDQLGDKQSAESNLLSLGARIERLSTGLAQLAEQLNSEERRAREGEERIRCSAEATSKVLADRLTNLVEALRLEFGTDLGKLEQDFAARLAHPAGARERIERLESLIDPDSDCKIREMVRPIARLHGASTVGSAIVLASRPGGEPERYENYLLTSYHVVRDILHDSTEERRADVQVTLYEEGGTVSSLAEMLAFDEELDLALLQLSLRTRWEYPAVLADIEVERDTGRFSPVYAVGCPLGNDPVPTRGEVISCEHVVEGQRYWMISAPSYFGNSGGGVFRGDSHELVGIFSKIYTHGRTFPTVVPHMGLLTPASSIRKWLVGEGFGELIGVPTAQAD